jgi:hypothetical protein
MRGHFPCQVVHFVFIWRCPPMVPSL